MGLFNKLTDKNSNIRKKFFDISPFKDLYNQSMLSFGMERKKLFVIERETIHK